ncbi:MAG TPA: hypothetical protein VK929_08710 [Longimicrobiales bacterium]|nr:hypothetical protein [Longimicrobiales bacterium]
MAHGAALGAGVRTLDVPFARSLIAAAAGLVVGGAGDLWWLMHDSPAGNSSYRVVRADGTPCCRVESKDTQSSWTPMTASFSCCAL